jgi:hypothetical protein
MKDAGKSMPDSQFTSEADHWHPAGIEQEWGTQKKARFS